MLRVIWPESKHASLLLASRGQGSRARIGGRGEVLTRAEWLDQFVAHQAAPVMVSVRKRAERRRAPNHNERDERDRTHGKSNQSRTRRLGNSDRNNTPCVNVGPPGDDVTLHPRIPPQGARAKDINTRQ